MKHEEAGDLGHVLSARELADKGIIIPEGALVLTRDVIRHSVGQLAAQEALSGLSEVTDVDD